MWSDVAEKSGYSYKLVRYNDLAPLMSDIKSGKIDVGMGGISITSDREREVDFSKPYLNTGLKIAVLSSHEDQGFFKALREGVFIRGFFESLTSIEVKVIGFWFLVFIIIMAHIVWAAELGDGQGIHETYVKGIGQAVYFCLVTSSTVGYGDVTCRNIVGRTCSIFLIITGVAFFANLTGFIAAERAVEIVEEHDIKVFNDLKDKKVATKAGFSTSQANLADVGANVTSVQGDDWVEKAKAMLKSGKVDAIVYDSPVIDKITDPEIAKIDRLFYPQYYGFCFQEESELEEEVNVNLLSILSSNSYSKLVKEHYNY